MKPLIPILVIVLAGCADAQKMKEADVPAPAVSALHKMYPEVKDYKWYNEDGTMRRSMK